MNITTETPFSTYPHHVREHLRIFPHCKVRVRYIPGRPGRKPIFVGSLFLRNDQVIAMSFGAGQPAMLERLACHLFGNVPLLRWIAGGEHSLKRVPVISDSGDRDDAFAAIYTAWSELELSRSVVGDQFLRQLIDLYHRNAQATLAASHQED